MEPIVLTYPVDGEDFSMAGEASSATKKMLKQLGFSPDMIRRVAIAMYEGEINMVIHAEGGEARVEISQENVKIIWPTMAPALRILILRCRRATPLRRRRFATLVLVRVWVCRILKSIRMI